MFGIRYRRLGLVVYWALLLLFAGVFLKLAEDVYQHEGFALDRPVLAWLEAQQSPALTILMKGLTHLGSAAILGPSTLLLIVWLGMRKAWREMAFPALSVGGAAFLNLGAKYFFARPRPGLFPQVVPEQDFGFPSGHAMGSAAFFLALFLLCRRSAPGLALWVGGLGLLLTSAVSFSRLYLQVHFPSDVLAGLALGAAWVLGSIRMLRL
ncbi:MAG: phosphatase PAP2 family protein [Deinococcus sp.]|nr:phosphatase PAP2 family protein [Deinococcus sp.]